MEVGSQRGIINDAIYIFLIHMSIKQILLNSNDTAKFRENSWFMKTQSLIII